MTGNCSRGGRRALSVRFVLSSWLPLYKQPRLAFGFAPSRHWSAQAPSELSKFLRDSSLPHKISLSLLNGRRWCSWQYTVKVIKKQTNKNSDKLTVDYRSIVTRKCDLAKTGPEQKVRSGWQPGTALQTDCSRILEKSWEISTFC